MHDTVTCSPEIVPFVPTAASGETLADTREATKNREGWQRIIDKRLVEWGRNGYAFDEEGLTPPTDDVIYKACELATRYRNDGLPHALRVLPDGDGGIVFEWRFGRQFWSLEIAPNSDPVLSVFDDCQLVTTATLSM